MNLSGAKGPVVYISPRVRASRKGAPRRKSGQRTGWEPLREQMGVAAHPHLAPPLQGCAEHVAKAAFPGASGLAGCVRARVRAELWASEILMDLQTQTFPT